MRRYRGTTCSRGYGRAHERLRGWWRPYVEAGLVDCWRCGRRIGAREPWDLGHDDYDRSVYRGPEHASCNRSAARAGKRTLSSRPRAW